MDCLSVLNYGSKVLKSNNIKTHRLDAELLLAEVLNNPDKKNSIALETCDWEQTIEILKELDD